MSESEHRACKAIMEQKGAKGIKCWRPPKENGYCGIHQKHALLEKAAEEGHVKCRTHRCIEILNSSDLVYCKKCIDIKNEQKSKIQTCKAIIDQGPTKGSPCSRKANETEYCGKHAPRQILVQKAAKQEKRICDDGKRACKNFTEDNKLLCEDCLGKCREYDNQQYAIRKETGKCLECAATIDEHISGLRDKSIQRCAKCYEKMRITEDSRIRDERNYNAERKKNIEPHYKLYKKGANVRNLWFELTIEQFTELVNTKCFYCDVYTENEVIGIDRVDSELGYSIENCVPCCQTCNFMKSDMNVREFLSHISKIAKNIDTLKTKLELITLTESNTIVLKESHKSYIRPAKIVDMFMKQSLDEYITICKKENRNVNFIHELEKISTQKMKRKEFNEYLKNLLSNCDE